MREPSCLEGKDAGSYRGLGQGKRGEGGTNTESIHDSELFRSGTWERNYVQSFAMSVWAANLQVLIDANSSTQSTMECGNENREGEASS